MSRTAPPTDAQLLAGGRAADFGVFYERHVAAVTCLGHAWLVVSGGTPAWRRALLARLRTNA